MAAAVAKRDVTAAIRDSVRDIRWRNAALCARGPSLGAHGEKSGCRGSGPGSESRARLVPQRLLQHLRVQQAPVSVSAAIDLVATITYNHGSQFPDEIV
jgi:hypothetical protein